MSLRLSLCFLALLSLVLVSLWGILMVASGTSNDFFLLLQKKSNVIWLHLVVEKAVITQRAIRRVSGMRQASSKGSCFPLIQH